MVHREDRHLRHDLEVERGRHERRQGPGPRPEEAVVVSGAVADASPASVEHEARHPAALSASSPSKGLVPQQGRRTQPPRNPVLDTAVPPPPDYVAGHARRPIASSPGNKQFIHRAWGLQLTRRHLLACRSWRTIEVE